MILSLLVALGCGSGATADDEGATGAGADGSGGSSGGTGGTGGKGGGTVTGGSMSGGKGGKGAAGGTGGTPSAAGSSAKGGGSGNAGEDVAGDSGKGGSGGTGGASGTSSSGGSGGQVTNHTNPLSQALIDAFVAAHNAARAKNDLVPPPDPPLPPVSWDAILADAAYNYLSQCKVDGDLVDHNDKRTEDYAALGGSDYVGENIYASTGSTVEPSDAVDSWMSEQKSYDYELNDLLNAGHYTQVVWRDSVRIGCAIVNCPNARFNNTVLCDYAPGGNISGQKPY